MVEINPRCVALLSNKSVLRNSHLASTWLCQIPLPLLPGWVFPQIQELLSDTFLFFWAAFAEGVEEQTYLPARVQCKQGKVKAKLAFAGKRWQIKF